MSISKKLLIVSALVLPVMANAATLVNQKDASTDVTFLMPNQFTHTLTSVKNLTSGTFSTPTAIAAGTINTSSQLSAKYALQFPVSQSTQTAGIVNIIVKGKANASNTITVNLRKDPTMTAAGAFTSETISGSLWAVYNTPVDVLKYEVTVNGEVKADTYPITVSAAVYTV
ncbi:Saf-pilin pilus formation protein SafA [Yersinia intermedia]|uniref:hypothetical protein n=1 Tax=Yersinia intermedia TaxID=631 RepID=UPI0005E7B689|nr:hypothetical protein [Yersinia intermedia]CND04501.1 Saf-pilin pilus formation protein SafA [Yersinia intermedia]CNH38217.1 Saf-pilin pilus formation protein SafA [Yersinia intermedia]